MIKKQKTNENIEIYRDGFISHGFECEFYCVLR